MMPDFEQADHHLAGVSTRVTIGMRVWQCVLMVLAVPLMAVVFAIMFPVMAVLLCWSIVARTRYRRRLRKAGRWLKRDEAVARLKSGQSIMLITVYEQGASCGWVIDKPPDMNGCPFSAVEANGVEFGDVFPECVNKEKVEREWLGSVQDLLSNAMHVDLGIGKWWKWDVPVGSMRLVYYLVASPYLPDI